MELQAAEEQAQPGGDCLSPEGEPEPDMQTRDQQENLQSAEVEVEEVYPSQSCQVIPGDRGAKGPPVPSAKACLFAGCCILGTA